MLKRFLYFNGYVYYPSGGWDDFKQSFDTLEEAKAHAAQWPGEWNHIVDLETGEVIESYRE